MTHSARLSSKKALLSQHGFALNQSEEPGYHFDWHQHDCAMLMWPQAGGLRCDWLDDDAAGDGGRARSARLGEAQAILLPASAAHQTVGDARRRRHGELYLAADLFPHGLRYGALCLDPASQAMLRALTMPSLAAGSAEPLVHAIVRQLGSGRLAEVPEVRGSVARRMVDLFSTALRQGRPMPSIDAVAAELGCSTRQLQRECERDLGERPVTVRRQLLARHARALMAGGRSLSEASLLLDFASSGHLGRLLRAVPDPEDGADLACR